MNVKPSRNSSDLLVTNWCINYLSGSQSIELHDHFFLVIWIFGFEPFLTQLISTKLHSSHRTAWNNGFDSFSLDSVCLTLRHNLQIIHFVLLYSEAKKDFNALGNWTQFMTHIPRCMQTFIILPKQIFVNPYISRWLWLLFVDMVTSNVNTLQMTHVWIVVVAFDYNIYIYMCDWSRLVSFHWATLFDIVHASEHNHNYYQLILHRNA